MGCTVGEARAVLHWVRLLAALAPPAPLALPQPLLPYCPFTPFTSPQPTNHQSTRWCSANRWPTPPPWVRAPLSRRGARPSHSCRSPAAARPPPAPACRMCWLRRRPACTLLTAHPWPASHPAQACLRSGTPRRCCRAPTPPSLKQAPARWPPGEWAAATPAPPGCLHGQHNHAHPPGACMGSCAACGCVGLRGAGRAPVPGPPCAHRPSTLLDACPSPAHPPPPIITAALGCSTEAWPSSWRGCGVGGSGGPARAAGQRWQARPSCFRRAALSGQHLACPLNTRHARHPCTPTPCTTDVGVQAAEHVWCCCIHLVRRLLVRPWSGHRLDVLAAPASRLASSAPAASVACRASPPPPPRSPPPPYTAG